MRKSIFYFIIIFASLSQAFAQETIGFSGSIYSGNLAIRYNPASYMFAKKDIEVNIIALDIFARTNYLYLPDNEIRPYNDAGGQDNVVDVFDYYTTEDKSAYAQAWAKGPSFYIRPGNFYVGVQTGITSYLSAIDVPFHVAKFVFEGFDYSPQHSINYIADPFRLAALSFFDLGISGGAILLSNSQGILSAGVTYKYLIGLNSLYIDSRFIDYEVPSSDLLIVNNMDAIYGYAFDESYGKSLFDIRGRGSAIDLGLMYRKESSNKRKPYDFQLGLSVVDLGKVKYNREAKVFNFDGDNTIWPGIDTVKFTGFAEMDSTLGSQFTSNPDGAFIASDFSVGTPLGFNLSFDVPLNNHWYVYSMAMYGPQARGVRVTRPTQFATSIRYERDFWGVSIPYSFYNFVDHRLGLAGRIGPLWIGSDKIGSFINNSAINGFDFYMALKFAWNYKGKNVNIGDSSFSGNTRRRSGFKLLDCPGISP